MTKVYAVVLRYKSGIDQLMGFFATSEEADEAIDRLFLEGDADGALSAVAASMIHEVTLGTLLSRTSNWIITPSWNHHEEPTEGLPYTAA